MLRLQFGGAGVLFGTGRADIFVAHTVNGKIVNATLIQIFVGVVVSRNHHSYLVISSALISLPKHASEIIFVENSEVANLTRRVHKNKATLVG